MNQELMRQVAINLDGNLVLHDNRAIIKTRECTILIRPQWQNNNKLEISWESPCCPLTKKIPYIYKYNEKRPEIRVSCSKTAEQIAKDIKRRLYPVAIEFEARANEAITKIREGLNRQETIVAQLRAVGADVWDYCNYGREHRVGEVICARLNTKLGELTLHIESTGSFKVSSPINTSIEKVLSII